MPHPAHRPERAPARALPAARVGSDVAAVHAVDGSPRTRLGLVHLAPEVVLGKIVGPLQAWDRVVAGLGPDEPTCLSRSGEAAVQAAQRLHSDEVAKRENVERDLQLVLD